MDWGNVARKEQMTPRICWLPLSVLIFLTCLRDGSSFGLGFRSKFQIRTQHVSHSNKRTGIASVGVIERYQVTRSIANNSVFSLLGKSKQNQNDDRYLNQIEWNQTPLTDWSRFALFSLVGFLYWYLLVLGAAAQANGLPVPDFIPMTPGWPTTDTDLSPVLEDSYHFFYLSELLQNKDAPYVIPPRLAVFNVVESWIFAMLPALWWDKRRRIPRPILFFSWLLLGINLTNAFLAPYLAITELRFTSDEQTPMDESSPGFMVSIAFPRIFGIIAATVGGYALYQSIVVATTADWSEFFALAQRDRSYLAFCVDPILFGIFQPLILARVKPSLNAIDYLPFVGLIVWLFTVDQESTKEV